MTPEWTMLRPESKVSGPQCGWELRMLKRTACTPEATSLRAVPSM